ncbi:FAD-binding and (Fe-S)-binding domain-containing protein [Haloplanus salinarum]|uniref:FAD-binding and (Fe-S)-binding domain-containing protein n=1 Tax=Haloplanus salinarum TaxID=1912324 RepID=UPI00214C9877|nr:FAD-binding and (Fe-S)-binding domain-containing protein [Haloplanus salinarum]
MATEHFSHDPAADERADYDYQGQRVERPGLVDDLKDLAGDVRFDEYSRQMYATDASAYEVTPIGVVFPTSTDDVAAVVDYCADREIPVLPRGGGTSLAGQAVNEAVVLDFTRHMNGVTSIDPEGRTATAEPGVLLGELDAELKEYDLKFAPDPAWGDKSALGGAIGNNSTGAHSLKYGKTDAYVEEIEAILADGTVTTFGEIAVDDLHDAADPDADDLLARIYAEVVRILDGEAGEIEKEYPDLKRNVSGYNLDVLVGEARDGDTVNLARLLAGSEGTLAIVTEATVSLEPIPNTKSVALLTYEGLVDAVSDVAPIVENHDPAAVELVDDTLIDLASDTSEFEDVVEKLPGGTRSALLVEFYAEDDDDGRKQVADLLADRVPSEGGDADTVIDADVDRYAFDALEAHDEETRAQLWKLRKSGLPILKSRTTDRKHVSFIEDCAVPPVRLPEYVEGFRDILDDHDTFASFYAHAGPGVLHVRPLLNLKDGADVEAMEDIADRVTDLVVELGGSVSGEHGDGRARSQWNEKLYGEELWGTFRALKTAFDPGWLLNPGQVCGVDPSETGGDGPPQRAATVSTTENLRYGSEYDFEADFEPELEWRNDNGFQGMAELCHGCGGCRGEQETTGDVMCPTYRASKEEITSTRGRANLLRQAMSGDLPEDEQFDVEFMHEVMDLCIGCKGCANDCPSEVDMAKMKAEITHEHHQREGASLRDRLFANVDTLAEIGSRTAPISNWATKISGARELLEETVGIAADRTLPTFRSETFQDWWEDRGGAQVSKSEAEREVVFFADTYTNYSDPEVGEAAVRVLEAAGVHVAVAERTDSGRPAHSKGFLEKSRKTAKANVRELAPKVEDGKEVVLVEPSDAVMFQSDYLDLLDSEAAKTLAGNAYGVCEYLDTFRLDENVDWDTPDASFAYHGHCHQKATKKDHHAVGVLRRAGYDIDPLDSGCCGMAGSFGYEAEHKSMSDAIAAILYDQIDDSPAARVVAPGTSCRTQLGDRDGRSEEPPTPVEVLARVASV